MSSGVTRLQKLLVLAATMAPTTTSRVFWDLSKAIRMYLNTVSPHRFVVRRTSSTCPSTSATSGDTKCLCTTSCKLSISISTTIRYSPGRPLYPGQKSFRVVQIDGTNLSLIAHNIQGTYEALRKRCWGPLAYGLCSSKAIISLTNRSFCPRFMSHASVDPSTLIDTAPACEV